MDGILLIDKDEDCTSYDVIRKIKKLFKGEKIGHTGTLDPIATGLLILCIGKATKLSLIFMNLEKEYVAKMKLGAVSDTLDADGTIKIVKENCSVEPDSLKNVLRKYIGEIEQIPPMYSAKKVQGKKLYQYARKGLSIERKPIRIKISERELIQFSKDEAEFRVRISKGGYVRVLCDDIGRDLGCGGYMLSLRRTKIGEFDVKNAIKVSELLKLENPSSKLIQVSEVSKLRYEYE
jgi:tRNA pseudouridine55 synthase